MGFRTSMFVLRDFDVCRRNGQSVMLLEHAADGILRSEPPEKPFSLPLFRAT